MLHKSLWIQNVQRHMGWQWSAKSAKKKGNHSLKMLEIHPAIRGDWFLWKNLMSLVAKHPCWLIKCVASYPVLNLNCPILTKKQTFLHASTKLFADALHVSFHCLSQSLTSPRAWSNSENQACPCFWCWTNGTFQLTYNPNKRNLLQRHLDAKNTCSLVSLVAQCPENSFATCCSLLIQPLRQGKCNS